jgi:MerR family redox-sensitive transcriptional activator SoxR
LDDRLTIGDIARRAGVTPSALRFYESRGLIGSERTAGNQRRYRREMLRRIAFIRIAQRLGVELAEIERGLASLPGGRTPTKRDWEHLSTAWRSRLDERIALLSRLRDQLASCIGCGCLSLPSCPIYNPEDAASSRGPGPRYLLGDKPADVVAGTQALTLTRSAARVGAGGPRRTVPRPGPGTRRGRLA